MLGHRLRYGGGGWRLFAPATVRVHLQQPTPAVRVPLWGGDLPTAEQHDAVRGWACLWLGCC